MDLTDYIEIASATDIGRRYDHNEDSISDIAELGFVILADLYLFENGSLNQITKDHTLLQELVDQGFYTPEEAKDAPNKNIVTRGLGAEASVVVDVSEHYINKGNKLLLCSDGLTDMLEDNEILDIMSKYQNNNQACVQALINSANENGGLDNVSAIIAEVKNDLPSDGKSFSRVLNWLLK